MRLLEGDDGITIEYEVSVTFTDKTSAKDAPSAINRIMMAIMNDPSLLAEYGEWTVAHVEE